MTRFIATTEALDELITLEQAAELIYPGEQRTRGAIMYLVRAGVVVGPKGRRVRIRLECTWTPRRCFTTRRMVRDFLAAITKARRLPLQEPVGEAPGARPTCPGAITERWNAQAFDASDSDEDDDSDELDDELPNPRDPRRAGRRSGQGGQGRPYVPPDGGRTGENGATPDGLPGPSGPYGSDARVRRHLPRGQRIDQTA